MTIHIATLWRWHFFSGLFCLPFVAFLSLTGAVYLFKPQIDDWIDWRYDH
ncbi:PepSY domain-containing protein, partial [Acetobacter fabarum]